MRDASRTLGDWCAQWRASTLSASNRKASTVGLYRSISRTHLETGPLGSTPLDRLRPSDVDAFIVRLQASGKATSTVARIFHVLRAALDDARRDSLIAHNPARLVRQPAVVKTEAQYLSADEVTRLLREAENTRAHNLLALIASLGLRKGEALALRWVDVDLAPERRQLKVRGTLARIDGRLIITEPKTGKSRRTLPLSDAVAALLENHRSEQSAERIRAGNQWSEQGLVFTTVNGLPVDPSNVLREIKKAATKAGLPPVTVHALRHSAATTLLEAGVHLRGVSDLLGHADIRTTAEIYGHLSDEVARTAMDTLSSAFRI